MNRHPTKPQILADQKTCQIVKNYLESNNHTNSCSFTENKNTPSIALNNQKQEKNFTLPIRFGTVLDKVFYNGNEKNNKPAIINFKNGFLDTNQAVFQKHTCKKQLRLTEKEIKILLFLYKEKGKITPRHTLLNTIWNYADNVETHTLETHIYRLRQKIEENPANPEILITENDGYKIQEP